MSGPLPTSNAINQTGRLGVTVLQARIEREGWIFRRQDLGDSDFGMDGEIEIVDRNRVTGCIAKCQVKSCKKAGFRKGRACVTVKVTTYNLWRASPMVTILFLIDTSHERIFWTPALAHHPKGGAKRLSICFEESSELGGDLGMLKSYLRSWLALKAGEATVREMPVFHRMCENLQSSVDHYDDWCVMPEDEDAQFRLLYQHVLRLRLEVGLSNDVLPVLDEWYVRSAGVWESEPQLYWGTFSEAMKMLGPAYEEALQRVAERVIETGPTFQNQELWNFVQSRKDPRHMERRIVDSRAGDPEFHARIEESLKKLGALKYPYRAR